MKLNILNEIFATFKWGRECPVDKMAAIRKNVKGNITFKFTAAALMGMSVFIPGGDKKVEYFVLDYNGQTLIKAVVEWIGSQDTMTLYSGDLGKTFLVDSANTEEIICRLDLVSPCLLCTIDAEY